ncbi:Two component regulator propeller [Tenacibaculum sp. MAR_2009_124]|uniref:histidine kinase n=1 Tax=Tenacibaculum sp. MAR_2009_124 TaxID=1250059 RepID=UPI0008984CB7|nr:histidine kinase [Tenacibaculum sp. MAR_2009_124]SEB36211.1 Two component regulator propeller [Tenacibaculum sp. MAR_2009_124]
MKLVDRIIFLLFILSTNFLVAQQNSYSNAYFDSNPNGNRFNSYTNYTEKEGLLSNRITCIIQDKLGYLWFGSNKGLTRFDGSDFKNFTKKNGISANYISALSNNNDSLFIGSPSSFSIRRNNSFKFVENKEIFCITPIEKTVFIGTSKGVYRLAKGFLAPLRTNFQIDLNQVNDIQFDGKNYWVATNKALWKIDYLRNPKSIDKIESGNFTSLLLLKNKIVASTLNSGIKIVHNEKVSTVSISTNNIKGIRKIGNQYWAFSPSDGIEVLNNNFTFNRKINKYNTFKTNAITDIFEDSQRNVWVATLYNGIFKFKDTIHGKSFTPSISFENIEVLHQPIDSISFNGYDKVFELPSHKNHLAFSYKAIDINNPKNIVYRYKLNGDYSPWSNKSSVNLANLSAGEYTFSVQSKVSNQQESTPIHFQFYIDKPFYQKLWFKWSVGVFLLAIIGFFIFLYVKKLQGKNEEKIKQLQIENHLLTLEQKALQLQMNPHFVFNVLNGIKALGNAGKVDDLNSTISKFSSLLRSVLNTSRKDDISLAEEIQTLDNYVCLEQQMSHDSFTYTINTKLSLDTEEIMIPPMLVQPFVENSIKHGIKSIKDGKLTINFFDYKNFLHCEIIDNGIGIFHSQKAKNKKEHASLALKVTKERIKNLGSETSINFTELKENQEILGTKVWFKIPLKTDF